MRTGFLKINGKIVFEENRYFQEIYRLIKESDFLEQNAGLYEVDNKNLYYNLVSCKTKDINNTFAESHKEYIDFHYMLDGEEIIGFSDYESRGEVSKAYDPEKDVELFSNIKNENFLLLKEGMFIVFYPNEIHRPGVAFEGNIQKIKKIIFKVKASCLF